jgi:predicted Kef-type K+ transport protein
MFFKGINICISQAWLEFSLGKINNRWMIDPLVDFFFALVFITTFQK